MTSHIDFKMHTKFGNTEMSTGHILFSSSLLPLLNPCLTRVITNASKL